MSNRGYHLAGAGITTVRRLLRTPLRVTGTDNLIDQPTLFVCNHFTRLETALVPYVIYHSSGRLVRTLGMAGLFTGRTARFMQSVGVMSVKHPKRNRTIVHDLMTGQHDWVIYPEGGLIKNKKTVRGDRLHLEHPGHEGSPHTGAAMLALKAEISRQRYLRACEQEEVLRRSFYEHEYGISGCSEVSTTGVVIQPISITFHPMRRGDAFISKLAARLSKGMDSKLLEEITFESALLLQRCEIVVHFGRPIQVAEFLDVPTTVARRILSRFSEQRHTDVLLRRQARRLTRAAMRSVYGSIELNFDHLVSAALREREDTSVNDDDLRAAVMLAAHELANDRRLTVHRSLNNDLQRLVTDRACESFDRTIRLALSEGAIQRDGQQYIINRAAFDAECDFNAVRLSNMTRVLANEAEAIPGATKCVNAYVNMPTAALQRRVAEYLHTSSMTGFASEYEQWYAPTLPKPADYGHPFLLESPGSVGVLLAHGYLSSPRQVRALAEFLHEQGYSVYAVRLPGHGTSPEHLSQTKWTDWLDALRTGYSVLQRHCDQVVVGGMSLGGALAMILAASPDIDPDAVFAINPPIKLRDRRAAFVPAVMRWRNTLGRVGIGRQDTRLLASNTETPEVSYERHSLRSVQQVRQVMAACRRRMDHITVPLLIVQADDDPVLSPAGARWAVKNARSELRLLAELAYDRHNIINGDGKELVFLSLYRFLVRTTGRATAKSGPAGRPVGSSRRWRRRLARAGFVRA